MSLRHSWIWRASNNVIWILSHSLPLSSTFFCISSVLSQAFSTEWQDGFHSPGLKPLRSERACLLLQLQQSPRLGLWLALRGSCAHSWTNHCDQEEITLWPGTGQGVNPYWIPNKNQGILLKEEGWRCGGQITFKKTAAFLQWQPIIYPITSAHHQAQSHTYQMSKRQGTDGRHQIPYAATRGSSLSDFFILLLSDWIPQNSHFSHIKNYQLSALAYGSS